ncbi:hypothetical protein JCM10296v2_007593 [Rhodotorula toruloides]
MSRLSLAQTLPPELLTRIFGWLVEIQARARMGGYGVPARLIRWPYASQVWDLCAMAVVCRKWRGPAQRLLFTSILIGDIKAKGLITALKNRPDLGEAVRVMDMEINAEVCLSIDYSADKLDEMCDDRLTILSQCPNVRHLVTNSVRYDYRERYVGLLDSLNLETFIFREEGWQKGWTDEPAFLPPLELCSLVQKPQLRTLELCLIARELSNQHTFPPSPGPISSVTSLCLQIGEIVCTSRLLDMMANTLKRLDIVANLRLVAPDFRKALKALHELEELRLCVGPMWWETQEEDLEWFRAVLPRLTALRKLALDNAFVDAAVVTAAPPSLRCLEYYWFAVEAEDVLPVFQRFFQDGSTRMPYTFFRLFVDSLDGPETLAEQITALTRVCDRRGIELDVCEHGTIPTHYEPEHLSLFWFVTFSGFSTFQTTRG